MTLPVIRPRGKRAVFRKLPRSLMVTDAGILQNPGNGIRPMHILDLANDACGWHIGTLSSELATTETVIPGPLCVWFTKSTKAQNPHRPCHSSQQRSEILSLLGCRCRHSRMTINWP